MQMRSPGLPDVPTFEEAGFKGLVISTWLGVFVPAGTPAAIVDRLQWGDWQGVGGETARRDLGCLPADGMLATRCNDQRISARPVGSSSIKLLQIHHE
jgi:hypothetical protein